MFQKNWQVRIAQGEHRLGAPIPEELSSEMPSIDLMKKMPLRNF